MAVVLCSRASDAAFLAGTHRSVRPRRCDIDQGRKGCLFDRIKTRGQGATELLCQDIPGISRLNFGRMMVRDAAAPRLFPQQPLARIVGRLRKKSLGAAGDWPPVFATKQPGHGNLASPKPCLSLTHKTSKLGRYIIGTRNLLEAMMHVPVSLGGLPMATRLKRGTR